MAITCTLLTANASSTDSQTYDTASITPTANKPILIAATSKIFSGTPGAHSFSGCNLTFTEINNVVYNTGSTKRISLFRGISASPTTGTITITVSGTGNLRCCWTVVQLDGDINATTPVVQSAVNATAGAAVPYDLTVTLAALGDAANNAVFAAFANDDHNTTLTEGTGYTEISDVFLTEGTRHETQFKVPGTTTPYVTANTTSYADVGGIAVELAYQAAGGGTLSINVSDCFDAKSIFGGR